VPPRRKVTGFKPVNLHLSRRVLTHYVATCHDCEEAPSSPRTATVHATSEKHRVTETKHYVLEPPE
jgi:hypothetical protein